MINIPTSEKNIVRQLELSAQVLCLKYLHFYCIKKKKQAVEI